MIQQLAIQGLNQPNWIYIPGNQQVKLSAGICESCTCRHEDAKDGDEDSFCDLCDLDDHETIIDALTEYKVSTRVIYANQSSEMASIQLELPGAEASLLRTKMHFTVDLSYSALARYLGAQYRQEGIDYIQSFIIPVTATLVTYPDGETYPDDSFTHVIWDEEPFERIDLVGSAPHAGLEARYTIFQDGRSEMLLKVDPERLQGFLDNVSPYRGVQAA